jgi:hypothetical protein
MNRIYGKTVSELIKEYIAKSGVDKDDIIARQDIQKWFRKKYPNILKSTLACQIIKHTTNSPSRVHYQGGKAHEVLFQIDRDHFRLYNPKADPTPITEKPESSPEGDIEEIDDECLREFAYEKDLQQFLSKNLDIIESGLKLYIDPEDDKVTGLEFPCGQKFIDILAVDKNNDIVVIELKVSKGYERVIGQIARYIAWVKKNMAGDKQKVRGIIIARSIGEDLKLAASEIKNIDLFEYELNVKLRSIPV